MQEEKATQYSRWVEDPGWRGKVGFITPPHFSVAVLEFLKIAPEGIAANEMKTYLVKKGIPIKFTPSVENIAEAVKMVELCAMVLKTAGVDVIAQSGTPFSFVTADGLAFARDLQARIEKTTGIPTILMGLSVIKALQKMGCGSVAVACTYYSDALREKYAKFLEDAGFKVLGIENWVSQGLFDTQEEAFRGLVRRHHMGLVYKAAKIVASHHPEADCIVISGGGVFTMDLLNPLEMDLRKPVISSTAAQYWEIFCRLGVFEPIIGRGSLLASLDKGTLSLLTDWDTPWLSQS